MGKLRLQIIKGIPRAQGQADMYYRQKGEPELEGV
jgi:hypothetical protein